MVVRARVNFPGPDVPTVPLDDLLEDLFRQLGGTLYQIEEEIVRSLFGFAGRLQTGPFGYSIEARICEIVEELAGKCGYCARVHAGAPGWLWDKVWFKKRETQAVIQSPYPTLIYDRASEWAKVEGLKLVCESEWKRDIDEILKDFLKLVFAEAEFRLFVYQYQEKTADLCKAVVPWTSSRRFLLVGFAKDRAEFQVDSFVS
jgi:hypothetical protein